MRAGLVAVVITAAVLGLTAPSATAATAARHPSPGTVLAVGRAPLSPQYPSGTRAVDVRYVSTDRHGRPVPVSGIVLVPAGPAPRGGRPVVSWAHGTTGIGDGCAPSAVPGAYYADTLAAFLRHGYAVAATDYAGLGTPGVHPYLIADSEARATVDIVRAARRVVPGLSRTWVAAGHSQGGQAAWAVGELPPRYRHGLDYRGAVAFAPAPNFSPLVDDPPPADPLEQQFLAMTLVGARTQDPGLPLADYLGRDARALLPDVRSRCFDDLTAVFTAKQLPASQFRVRGERASARLQRLLYRHEIAHVRNTRPLLVLQGGADQIVPLGSTQAEVAESRHRGSDVRFETYAGADHGGVLNAGIARALAWLDRLRAQKTE